MEPRGAVQGREKLDSILTLTHLLSQLFTCSGTLVFLTHAAKLHHPLWDLGSWVSGPKYRPSSHLSPLRFHLVGFMRSLQAACIFLGPNSLSTLAAPLSSLLPTLGIGVLPVPPWH